MLVEVIISLFILGIIGSCSLPLLTELREMDWKQTADFEATTFLQEKMEELRSNPLALMSNGTSRRASTSVSNLTYFVKWSCRMEQSLKTIDVEVSWKDRRNHIEKRAITAYAHL